MVARRFGWLARFLSRLRSTEVQRCLAALARVVRAAALRWAQRFPRA